MGEYKHLFSIYEQLSNKLEDQTMVELTYVNRGEGQFSDFHGLNLELKQPGDTYAFAQIVIEKRNGKLSILVWPQPENINQDPIVYRPDPTKSTYCLKCGWDWSVHENGCVSE